MTNTPTNTPTSAPATGDLPLSKAAIASVILGLISLAPLFCTSVPIAAVGLLCAFIAFSATSGQAARVRGRQVMLIGVALCLGGFVIGVLDYNKRAETLQPENKPPQENRYSDANGFISSYNGSAAFGNTPQAKALAEQYSALLETRVRETFSGFKDSAFSTSNNKQLVYCYLTDDAVVFLVHVPELRRYKDDVRRDLRIVAWNTACEVTEGEHMTLVLGLRGTILKDSYIAGPNDQDLPAVKTSPSTSDFTPHFIPEKPTRTLTFTILGETDAIEDAAAPTPDTAEPSEPNEPAEDAAE